jgi:ribonuclease D
MVPGGACIAWRSQSGSLLSSAAKHHSPTPPASTPGRRLILAASQLCAYRYKYIDDREAFRETCESLSEECTLAVDLECEYDLHRYGKHLCLIQVATATTSCDSASSQEVYLIDPFSVGPLDPILNTLEDPEIQIILHGPRSDIVLLDYLFGCRPTNIFDTEMAASLLGYDATSLKDLLQTKFGLNKNASLSRANWNMRPISNKLLDYAALDVAYCHALKDRLHFELVERNRITWHQEECMALEDIRYRPKPSPHLKLKGASALSQQAQFVLKHLFEIRKEIAFKLDKPVYHIISNPLLVALAHEPPRDWSTLQGVHEIVRGNAAATFENAVRVAHASASLVQEDTNNKPPVACRERRRTQQEIQSEMEQVERLKRQFQLDYSDVHSLILPRQTKTLKLDNMKAWKRSIIQETAKKLQLDALLEILTTFKNI